MKIKFLIFLSLFSVNIFTVDNEVSIDQAGATANLDIEQMGSGNLIGGASAVSGTMTPLDLDGTTMTLDINQLGNSNIFKGDIYADNYTGFLNLQVIQTLLMFKQTLIILMEQMVQM